MCKDLKNRCYWNMYVIYILNPYQNPNNSHKCGPCRYVRILAGGGKQVWEASLSYLASSSPAYATEWSLVTKTLPLAIREIQAKTTLRFHLTTVRMVKFKNTNDSLYWRGCGARGTLLHCWWPCKLVQPLWKSIWRFLQKLGINLPQDPVIPILGITQRMLDHITRTLSQLCS